MSSPSRSVKKITGRPKFEMNWEQFDALCRIQCTLEEISSVLGCSEDTVERACKRKHKKPFKSVWEEKASLGRASLRRIMFEKALKEKDNTMLIWLSKNHLKMSDKPDAAPMTEKPTSVNIIWSTKPDNQEQFYDKPSHEEDLEDDFLPAVEF